jgi:hypothetical protein
LEPPPNKLLLRRSFLPPEEAELFNHPSSWKYFRGRLAGRAGWKPVEVENSL